MANIRISKNKSNSQLLLGALIYLLCCGKYQNFKEQKQFTTFPIVSTNHRLLWQISEFQRTKAIHNIIVAVTASIVVVANIRIYSLTFYFIFSGIHPFAPLGSKNKKEGVLHSKKVNDFTF